MNSLGIPEDLSNKYKPGDRTQVLYCFTIKSKKYAYALINTLRHSYFESINDFVIFCCDKESQDIIRSYGLPYRDSKYDVYNGKILNAMKLSIENKDTLIVSVDVIVTMDFHSSRGAIGANFKNLEDNSIYALAYGDMDYLQGWEYNDRYKANIICFWNIKDTLVDKYIECMKISKQIMEYPKESKERYYSQCNVTEEDVINQYANELRVIHCNRIMIQKLLRYICPCLGGATLDYLIKNNVTHYNAYTLDSDILDKLRN